MADGKVDLSGVWFPGPTGKANAWSVVPDQRWPQEEPIPFQPWAEAKFEAMTRTEQELYGNANVTVPAARHARDVDGESVRAPDHHEARACSCT